jgi:hypothetical protein
VGLPEFWRFLRDAFQLLERGVQIPLLNVDARYVVARIEVMRPRLQRPVQIHKGFIEFLLVLEQDTRFPIG